MDLERDWRSFGNDHMDYDEWLIDKASGKEYKVDDIIKIKTIKYGYTFEGRLIRVESKGVIKLDNSKRYFSQINEYKFKDIESIEKIN